MGRSFEPKQMLVVDPPSEIVFEGPFNRAVCKKVMVFNPCNYRVAFKLKTTTPRLFFVRPNVGLIKPNESFTIDIFMHPLVSNSSALRSNHKFLMQAVEANDFVPDLHSFWRSINPASIWDTKIKVKLIEGKTDVQQTGSDQEHGNGEHQDTDVNDPLGLLLKQVNTLEEEKQSLLKQVETLDKENEENKQTTIKLQRMKGPGFGYFVGFLLMVALAFVAGGFLATNYT